MSNRSRNEGAAEAAAAASAAAASEAGRILQAQRQTASEGGDVPAPRSTTEPRPDAEVERDIQKAKDNHPHKLTMEEIRRKRAEQEGTLENAAKSAPAAPPKPKEAPQAEPKVAEPAAATDTPTETTTPDAALQQETTPATPPVQMVKVKVDGVESQVPQSDIDEAGGITAYQRDKASENRLTKSNETLAEAKRMQASVAAWVQAQQIPAKPVVSDDQFVASKMDAIRFGTPEESAAAMREVQARLNPPVNHNAVVLQATTSMKRDSAMEQFNKEFQDVNANPLLKTLLGNLEQQRLSPYVQNGNVNWQGLAALDWSNFYRTIGNEVRSVMGPRQSQPSPSAAANAGEVTTTGNSSQASEKEARKASIVTLPTASARAELPNESKPETREDSLNRMRKSRGQPIG